VSLNIAGQDVVCPDPECGEREAFQVTNLDSRGGKITCLGKCGKTFNWSPS
jgi:hypothetical protein